MVDNKPSHAPRAVIALCRCSHSPCNLIIERWIHKLSGGAVEQIKFDEMDYFAIRYGVTANITAFHAVARGSIPRIGALFFLPLRLVHCAKGTLSNSNIPTPRVLFCGQGARSVNRNVYYQRLPYTCRYRGAGHDETAGATSVWGASARSTFIRGATSK